MRIKRARIQNFRCLEDVDITFDCVTTFIGPNGVGKSTVLRALDWFFNGGTLSDEDVLHGAATPKIRVEIEFDQLTVNDRDTLEKYAPSQSETVTIWRTWDNGEEKITGKAFAYPPFEEVRTTPGASAIRKKYHELRTEYPDLGLPSATSAANAEEAMSEWERTHPDQLQEAEVSANHFFGFAGQGILASLFDYVLVTADLRASEETQDSKTSLLGRIIALTLDRSVADKELEAISGKYHEDQRAIHHRQFKPQLDLLSKSLTAAVGVFTQGRSIEVTTQHAEPRPPKVQFSVGVVDDEVTTRIELQGHGFQRAALIGALKHLAEQGTGSGQQGAICLAIEEPELYQHPIQARVFSTVLRKLAQDGKQQIQVTYATHSPIFIEANHFSQVRRVNRSVAPGSAKRSVMVSYAPYEAVIKRLDGFVAEETVKKQMDGVLLKRLPEALFADAAVLVEGTTDRGVLDGCAEHDSCPLELEGIAIADAGGKASLLLPHAILTLLGIPCYIVFDGDSGCKETDRGNTARHNRDILRYLQQPEEDWPSTKVSQSHTVFAVHLENELASIWPSWGSRVEELVKSGTGFPRKDCATYRHAAATVQGEVPSTFKDILSAIRALRATALPSTGVSL